MNDEFWQSEDRDIQEAELREQLQQRARTGEPMHAFKLQRLDLQGLDLVNHDHKSGYQLIHADLYRSNLAGGHFFNVDFHGTSLMKANLENANLNYADLSDCNLLGVNLNNAKLEHVNWGKRLLQESLARKTKVRAEKVDYYQQAEEIYRNLRKVTEAQGLFETAGLFFRKEMVMRRYQMPRNSSKRFISKMVDVFCGYGEVPMRVVVFSLIAIFLFATAYFFSGIQEGGQLVSLTTSHSFLHGIENYARCIYFSIVTFTTLGYGDISPIGFSRAIAATEAFIGSFTLALFVVVFVKKMTR